MRFYPNVVVFCTSNLIITIDPAFLDRVDFKLNVPEPCTAARYEILRTSLNEMSRCQLIRDKSITTGLKEFVMVDDSCGTHDASYKRTAIEDSWHARSCYDSEPDLAESRLWMIAIYAEGLSGRSLRRLPFTSFATQMTTEHCTLHEALDGLKRTVQDEIKAAKNMVV